MFALYICFLLIACNSYALENSKAYERFKRMSLEEKIGQILMPAIPCNPENPFNKDRLFTLKLPDNLNKEYAFEMINKYHVGSFLYICEGLLADQVKATNALQYLSKEPLLFGQDLEPLKRLEDAVKFPHVIALGSADNPQLTYELARALGKQAQRTGVHFVFAPVADVNNNTNNPVINIRSFGQDPDKVGQHVVAFIQGMQSTGTLAFAKHFAGHGDTAQDSHSKLPIIRHSREHLDAVELVPFKAAINAGVSGIMTGHILMSALDSTYPCSMSQKTKNLLNELGFKGLVISDALIMGALVDYFKQEEIILKAFAVNDILQFPADVSQAFTIIKNAVERGAISCEDLDAKVLKILKIKEELGLYKNRFVDEMHVVHDIVTPENLGLKKQIYEQAVIVAKNDCGFPFSYDGSRAVVHIGGSLVNPFVQTLQEERGITHFYLPSQATQEQCKAINVALNNYDTVIIGLSDMNKFASKQFGISDQILNFIHEISDKHSTHLVLFGTPYALKLFGKQASILVAFEDDADAHTVAAQILLGKHKACGMLPITVNDQFAMRREKIL